MPKRTGIRWKVGEKEELRKEIRRFNDRRRRAIKKNPDLINYLPTLSYMDIVGKITTRKDLNRVKKEINQSRAKNAFKIVKVGDAKTTKWQLRITKAKVRSINRQRQKELKEANPSTEKGTMGTIERNNLRDKRMPSPSSQTEWQKFVESAEKQVWSSYSDQKGERYRNNYIATFKGFYGNRYISELERITSALTAYQFAQAMYYSPILDIQFLYPDSDTFDYSETAEIILETWRMYVNTL